jgi:hypothetical protein
MLRGLFCEAKLLRNLCFISDPLRYPWFRLELTFHADRI